MPCTPPGEAQQPSRVPARRGKSARSSGLAGGLQAFGLVAGEVRACDRDSSPPPPSQKRPQSAPRAVRPRAIADGTTRSPARRGQAMSSTAEAAAIEARPPVQPSEERRQQDRQARETDHRPASTRRGDALDEAAGAALSARGGVASSTSGRCGRWFSRGGARSSRSDRRLRCRAGGTASRGRAGRGFSRGHRVSSGAIRPR